MPYRRTSINFRVYQMSHVKLMMFNKAKCKVLNLGQSYPRCVHKETPVLSSTLGEKLFESSPAEKDLRVLIDEKLNMSQQCVLASWKGNNILAASKEVWPAG